MRRLAIACAAALSVSAAGLLAGAAPAAAAPDNDGTLHITLDCGAGGTIAAVFQLSSADAFHVVGMSSNFLWKSLDYVTPDGQTGRIERGVNGAGHHNLVTCTYTGAVSGNSYTATGFFTPA